MNRLPSINLKAYKSKSVTDFDFLHNNYFKLFLKHTFTNIMLSLTDNNNKLIICHTAGSSGISGTSRRKTAPQAIELIIKKIYPFFVQHKIKSLELVLTRKVSQAAHYLIRELGYFGIQIIIIRRRRICAHNGVRPRKLPRK